MVEIAEATGTEIDAVVAAAEVFSTLSLDDGYDRVSWQVMLWRRDETDDPKLACLFTLVAQEQYGRIWLSELFSSDAPDIISQSDIQVMARLTWAIDSRNLEWLRTVVAEQGWFSISEYGETADLAAFLIAQHADHDLDFQREILARLDRLVDAEETRPSGHALLTDRVAVNSGEPQVFGSQGRCTGYRQWEAHPYTGTFEEMDERRESVGLEHHTAYVSRMNELCNEDQR